MSELTGRVCKHCRRYCTRSGDHDEDCPILKGIDDVLREYGATDEQIERMISQDVDVTTAMFRGKLDQEFAHVREWLLSKNEIEQAAIWCMLVELMADESEDMLGGNLGRFCMIGWLAVMDSIRDELEGNDDD